MPNHAPKPAPNYTSAFLWIAGIHMFFTLWVVAALWGFVTMMLIALGIDQVLRRLAR